jgi:hypothetical protein
MTRISDTTVRARQFVALLLLTTLWVGATRAQQTSGGETADGADAPSIIFTGVPPFGSTSENLFGRVLNVNPSDFRVAVLIFVPDLGWYTKPFCDPPLTIIQADGTFRTNVVTGGVDQTAEQYAAYLVPASFSHPCVLGAGAVPETVERQAVAKVVVSRPNPAQKVIRFSGYDWRIKTNVGRVFPGPNLFSDRAENVWLDAQGRLHLRITNRDGHWYAAEIISERTFGPGAYRFYLDGAVDDLDPSIVFGLFTFGMDPAFGHREIDIEFSRFGNASSMNAQYVIQPFNVAGNIRRFQMPAGVTSSVHGFDWRSDRINFQSWRGSQFSPPGDVPIQSWTYTQTIPTTLDEKAHINLWLFNDAPPSNGMEREVIVNRFEFVPASSDTAPPTLTDPQAGPVTPQTWGALVPLRVNVADDTGVTSAWAEVARPDGGVERVDLARTDGSAAGGTWVGTYRAPSNSRAYSVTFFARDASQNQGRSSIVDFGTVPNASIFHFSSSSFAAPEGGKAEVTVVRSGDLSASASVDYATSDGTASERSDYSTALGTLRFGPGEAAKSFPVFINDDGDAQGDETVNLALSNAAGAGVIGTPDRAVLTIAEDDAGVPTFNPIDDMHFFVRQHYVDFLDREPDPPGFNFWTGELASCGADARCFEVKRINVSAAFFLSIEFQQTGFLAYRLHQAAFGTGPLLDFHVFMRDAQEAGRGVVVLAQGWEQQLEANKQTLVEGFVARTEFTTRYPQTMTAAQFVDALNANTGGSLTRAERDALVTDLAAGAKTRAQALRAVAENRAFAQREFNRAFVYMQYAGYLRRAPSAPPDNNLNGYNFWLGKLNQFGGDYIKAEMVKAFLDSVEYRRRFGP